MNPAHPPTTPASESVCVCPAPIGKIIREDCSKISISYDGQSFSASVGVKGVGATGSARKLYEKILLSKKKAQQLAEHGVTLADRITDEITCHALGVKHCNPEIDTIFEVGGQDMKFTCFSPDGTVKEAKMNYSCQAGSGQTLENMADVINLDVESTLQEAALQARRVPIIDSITPADTRAASEAGVPSRSAAASVSSMILRIVPKLSSSASCRGPAGYPA